MTDFGKTLDEMDVEAFFNIRQWVEEKLTQAGAKRVGAGIGCGQADIDIVLEGHCYNISIKPRPMPNMSPAKVTVLHPSDDGDPNVKNN